MLKIKAFNMLKSVPSALKIKALEIRILNIT